MERRRHEKNRLAVEIKRLQRCDEVDVATLNRLRGQMETPYILGQIEKLLEKSKARQEELGQLKTRMEEVVAGTLDTELFKEEQEEHNLAKEKTSVTLQRKKDIAQKKAEQSVVSKAYYQSSRKSDRQNRYNVRSQKRSYQHFVRACNSIPDYMRRNLKEMPNNKGYFWKSVACYGERPAEPGQPTVLFDRKKGLLVIHEWTAREYRLYHKKGRDRKVLQSCTRRRPKQGVAHKIPIRRDA